MKINSTTFIILLCSISIFKANGQPGFHLTKDINVQTDASPLNQSSSYQPIPYAIFNNVMYFSANDGVHGNELWRSDGTAGGTYMVEDLEPGSGSSNPAQIIVSNNKIFFITNTQSPYGEKLWCSDGTIQGTIILKDSILLTSGMLTDVNGEVYFFLFNNPQLWKTDGTANNTVMVKDFGSSASYPFNLTSANGLLYFSIYTFSNGRELWRSDGTDNGTFLLKDINPVNFYDNLGPSHFTQYNSKLYFSAYDGSGYKLWYTDGTSNGTIKVGNQDSIYIITIDNYSNDINTPFKIANDKLIMAAFTKSTGQEVFTYNTKNGFLLLKDISPGSASGYYISSFTKAGKQVYFIYSDTLTGTDDIWSTDGSSSNTLLITSFDRGDLYNSQLSPGNNGLVYFPVYTKSYGHELWKTNGTAGNAEMIKDIYAGSTSANPQCLTKLNNKVFFSAASDTSGTELWETNGNAKNTFKVDEINSSYTASSAPSTNYLNIWINNFPGSNFGGALKNTLYFIAANPKTGLELYKSNGSASATALAKDLVPGEANANPREFITKNNNTYFLAEDSSYFTSVFKIDSLGNITKAVPYPIQVNFYDVANNGLVFFMTYNTATNVQQLWRSNGTVKGTFELSDKISFSNYAHRTLRTVGNKAFFIGNDQTYGYELWVSDGTVAGTKIVKDLAPGNTGSFPHSLIPFKNSIIFGASDYSSPYTSLWKSDGTSSGTVKLSAVTPWGNDQGDNYNDYFCIVSNNLFFAGSNYVTNEFGLWKTNGTSSGTVFVSNFNEPYSAIPSFLTNVQGTLCFTSSYKNNLWKSNGKSSGTKFLKTICGASYKVTERCIAGNKLFLVTNNPDSALWVSDGSSKNTHFISDSIISGLTNIRNIAGTDSSVYFNGYNLKYGDELYTSLVSNINPLVAGVSSGVQKLQNNFTVNVLGNPVTSTINLQINSLFKGKVIMLISNVRGIPVFQKQYDLIGTSLNASINCATWQSGLYIIKLTNSNDNTASITVLKE